MSDDDPHRDAEGNLRPTMEGAVLVSLPAAISERDRARITWFLGGVLRRSVEVHVYEADSVVEYDPPMSSFLRAARRLWDSWRRFR